jgi:hypothetical protein
VRKQTQTYHKVKDLENLYQKVSSDKHGDVTIKFGATLLGIQGIIDISGKNVMMSRKLERRKRRRLRTEPGTRRSREYTFITG